MRTDRTTNEGCELAYGQGLVNSIAYLLEGFRGWQCYGIVPVKGEDYWGLGLQVEDMRICAVYGNRHSVREESDANPGVEQAQIDAGKTAIILFYGMDNTSYMRRMTPEQFDKYSVTWFDKQPDDLFYNS